MCTSLFFFQRLWSFENILLLFYTKGGMLGLILLYIYIYIYRWNSRSRGFFHLNGATSDFMSRAFSRLFLLIHRFLVGTINICPFCWRWRICRHLFDDCCSRLYFEIVKLVRKASTNECFLSVQNNRLSDPELRSTLKNTESRLLTFREVFTESLWMKGYPAALDNLWRE